MARRADPAQDQRRRRLMPVRWTKNCCGGCWRICVRARARFLEIQALDRLAPDCAPHAGRQSRRPDGILRGHARQPGRGAGAARRSADFGDHILSRRRGVSKRYQDVLPELFKDKAADETMRVWVPGCATGEEAYSFAMLLLEEAARHKTRAPADPGVRLRSRCARARFRARRPLSAAIEADVSEERLRRFFMREGDHYRVRQELRDMVLFAVPRSAQRSAVFARRPDLLPQRADLSRSRIAGAGVQHVSLRAQSRRLSLWALRRRPTIRRACSAPSTARRASISRPRVRRQAAAAAAPARPGALREHARAARPRRQSDRRCSAKPLSHRRAIETAGAAEHPGR